MNLVILHGRLGKDVEIRFTSSGKAVTQLSVATNEGFGDKKHTEWHKVVVWDKQAEACGKFLSKGSEVIIEGRIATRKWEDKDGATRYSTEIVARHVQFVGGKKDRPAKGEPEADDLTGLELDDGEEIPF